ncbi:MAG: alpha/beta hydrolase, partial [Campylobacteraceae bacterium]|nr:alpha/beta hydrolase [Campylobacteraceae bacterium]
MFTKLIKNCTLYLKNIFPLFFVFLFIGCSKYSLENRINLAENIAQKAQFKSKNIKTDSFTLKTYTKVQDKTLALKIYIEGDGFAWINRTTLSPNPTPINPVALKLASHDPYKNIAYIARPCQYISTQNCSKEYWSDKRFSKEVIQSMNQAISILKKQTHSKKIELVGFSGGAAIALLIASKRNDVQRITTIAGNLNHKLLHEYHGIPPMKNSLNPIDIATKISHIKQT